MTEMSFVLYRWRSTSKKFWAFPFFFLLALYLSSLLCSRGEHRMSTSLSIPWDILRCYCDNSWDADGLIMKIKSFSSLYFKKICGFMYWLHNESRKKSFSSFYFKKICGFIWSEYMMNLIKQMVFYDWFYVWYLFTLENRYSESSFQLLCFLSSFFWLGIWFETIFLG